jgi:hypothetical protein
MSVGGAKPIMFLGPTLHRDQALRWCDADVRPPAAMGDVTRAVTERPPAIVIIDGVFEDRPAVWHKEILWALSCGIAVIGAASMGALRAAELHRQGMMGFGRVFDAYASGALTDDDEVAVMHGPEEAGFLPLTTAMVDIRHIVYAARAQAVVSPGDADDLVAQAKSRHFKQRNLVDIVDAFYHLKGGAAPAGVRAWFGSPPEASKARDCRLLLSNLSHHIAEAQAWRAQAPAFETTLYLRRLRSFGFDNSFISNPQVRHAR